VGRTNDNVGTSPVPLSPERLAKLRNAEGEGLSRDPKNNPRKTIKLLQEKDARSKWCPPGARAGQYQVGDTLCDNFICTPILFLNSYIEWTVSGGGGPETHYELPADTKWDQEARCWFRDNGNSVGEGAEIIGLVNGEVSSRMFRLGAVKVARQLNSAAGALVIETDQGPVQLPFYGANWRMGAIEKHGSNGKSYWQETYELIGTVGQPGGPSWDEFDRCQALCRILTRSIKPATAAGVEGKNRSGRVGDAVLGKPAGTGCAAPHARRPRKYAVLRQPVSHLKGAATPAELETK
jgi:hypothetical protein